MTTSTLLLVGGESFEWATEAAIAITDVLPNSRIITLEGQGHVAMNTAPERFVDTILEFIRDSE